MASWVPWLASWLLIGQTPLSRRGCEAILTILEANTIEFRVALLSFQIKQLFNLEL
jgi:hypothetical protein